MNNYKAALISLGCPKNQVDAEIMLKKLVDAGYILVDEVERADVVIVNTCAFIEDSKKESIDSILEMIDYKEDETYVYVVENGAAKKVAVELGIEAEDTIEITSGLSDGDAVVTKGQTYISDGEEVNVVNLPKAETTETETAETPETAETDAEVKGE